MRILVVDDERNIRNTFRVAIEAFGHDVEVASSVEGALQLLKTAGPFDVAFFDLKLSQESGLDLLSSALELVPRLSVVIVTAYASIETAVEAMRRGAFDYLPKPCTPEQIRQVLAKAEKTRRLENRVAELESRLKSEAPELDLQTDSPSMHKVMDVAFRAAASDATILLLGESGTGKSVMARAVHQQSPRRGHAFVTVSCPSLSRELLESELFGHVKGAFTGALSDTWGKVAAADGGTLFLDEIGDLPLEVQARLLRLLQEREYERVGETRPRKADVRVISATNHDLKAAVAHGKFREDLFYRLNVISLTMPPLRERVPDIPGLASRMLAFFAGHAGKLAAGFSPEARAALEQHPWPGNLRELRNVIERAVILSHGDTIGVADLSESVQPTSEFQIGGRFSLEAIENEHIRAVIASTRSLEEAAMVLGIDPATLYRRRKKLEK
ncbi:MAG TPA: sigma-54 dependent transcriptional regulator [Chthoniobacteraceae bacterium]|jgi:NtrC-family two-component system response regulator AlgB|nr:sigma-54 dependent transcriptional regulator [Chthoniobacteraceae bacterium]